MFDRIALIGAKLRDFPAASKHIPLQSPEACLKRRHKRDIRAYLVKTIGWKMDFRYANATKRFDIDHISDMRSKQRDLPDSSVNSRFNSTFILLSSSSSFGLK